MAQDLSSEVNGVAIELSQPRRHQDIAHENIAFIAEWDTDFTDDADPPAQPVEPSHR
jgi:hypothetical protein